MLEFPVGGTLYCARKLSWTRLAEARLKPPVKFFFSTSPRAKSHQMNSSVQDLRIRLVRNGRLLSALELMEKIQELKGYLFRDLYSA